MARSSFLDARLLADKLHVVRLVQPIRNRYLRDVATAREALLLRHKRKQSRRKLKPWWRVRLKNWLRRHPARPERTLAFLARPAGFTAAFGCSLRASRCGP